jgi:type II secretory pathway pseudopilin PulG
VTLLELLVVMAILAVILAVALPFTLRLLSDRELEVAEENVTSELLKARVRAQESGRPVEVMVMGAPAKLVIRFFDPEGSYPTSGPDDRPRPRSSGGPVRDTWWVESSLGASVRVTAAPTIDGDEPFATDGLLADGTADSASGTSGGMALGGSAAGLVGGPLRLAIFLPDGSLLYAASVILMHENGARSRVSVDPWTGQPAIARDRGPVAGAAKDPSAADAILDRAELDDPGEREALGPAEPPAGPRRR